MNWFQRHLNWSLALGIIIVPIIIVIIAVVLSALGLVNLMSTGAGEGTFLGAVLGMAALFIILGLVILAISIVVTWWYLGQKARSKAYLLLLLVPWGLNIIGNLLTSSSMTTYPDPAAISAGGIVGGIIGGLAGLTGLAGLIWLFLLENRAIGYGGDFAAEAATDRWAPDTGQYGTTDSWQPPKPLDYSPAKDVHDIEYDGGADIPGGEAKAAEPAGWQYASNAPILLDDTGAAIKCFYHPEADAVNLCSRCGQYVCSQCNYVTGTHPICRNCWERRGQGPISVAPAKKQEVLQPTTSEKPAESQVSAEPAIPTTPAAPEVPVEPAEPAVPIEPIHLDISAAPATPEVPVEATPDISAEPPAPEVPVEPVLPDISATPAAPEVPVEPAPPGISAVPPSTEVPVEQPVPPDVSAAPPAPEVTAEPVSTDISAVPPRPDVSAAPPAAGIPTEPPTSEVPAMPPTPDVPVAPTTPITPVTPTTPVTPDATVQEQEIPKLTKSDRRQLEDDERFRQFMLLYEQALPFISAVVTKNPDGLPVSPLDLMEGLKLGPMLKHAKKLPKLREKELQEAKKLFEQLLDACVKVGEKAADFVSSSGQVVPTEANYARLSDGVEKASVLMGQLYKKLPPPSQPQV